jgi:hypothetical protein
VGEYKAVRLVKAVLRKAGLPEAEGGTTPASPVTRPGWHAWPAAGEVRVTHWDIQVLTEPEKRAALAGYAPVLRAAGWMVAGVERGGFLAVRAAHPEEGDGDG